MFKRPKDIRTNSVSLNGSAQLSMCRAALLRLRWTHPTFSLTCTPPCLVTRNNIISHRSLRSMRIYRGGGDVMAERVVKHALTLFSLHPSVSRKSQVTQRPYRQRMDPLHISHSCIFVLDERSDSIPIHFACLAAILLEHFALTFDISAEIGRLRTYSRCPLYLRLSSNHSHTPFRSARVFCQ